MHSSHRSFTSFLSSPSYLLYLEQLTVTTSPVIRQWRLPASKKSPPARLKQAWMPRVLCLVTRLRNKGRAGTRPARSSSCSPEKSVSTPWAPWDRMPWSTEKTRPANTIRTLKLVLLAPLEILPTRSLRATLPRRPIRPDELAVVEGPSIRASLSTTSLIHLLKSLTADTIPWARWTALVLEALSTALRLRLSPSILVWNLLVSGVSSQVTSVSAAALIIFKLPTVLFVESWHCYGKVWSSGVLRSKTLTTYSPHSFLSVYHDLCHTLGCSLWSRMYFVRTCYMMLPRIIKAPSC